MPPSLGQSVMGNSLLDGNCHSKAWRFLYGTLHIGWNAEIPEDKEDVKGAPKSQGLERKHESVPQSSEQMILSSAPLPHKALRKG